MSPDSSSPPFKMKSTIQNEINGGRASKEIAILYRSNAQSRLLEEALIETGIPYRIYGGLRFFERAEIKNILAYLRLISNHLDDNAFERIVNLPTRGIGNTTLQTLRETARSHNTSLWQACDIAINHKLLNGRAVNALEKFIGLMNELTKDCESLSLPEKAEFVLKQSGLMAHYKKDMSEKGLSRVDNANEFIQAAKDFNANATLELEENLSELDHFLAHVSLEAGDNQSKDSKECVQLMTLHSAKGLEFPLVFLTGLEEGLFPHQMCLNDENQLEEERRLCYVGITRAMEKLYITYAEVRRLHGKESYRKASRFIEEIPTERIDSIRITSSRSSQSASSFTQNEMPFKLGQRVNHARFGTGIVINFEGSADNACIQVKFDRFGTKWLVTNKANLQPA